MAAPPMAASEARNRRSSSTKLPLLAPRSSFPPTPMMPMIVVAGDHRREQQVAAGAAEKLRHGDGHRLARGQHLFDGRLVQDGVGRRRDLDAEREELLDVELFIEREDEADGGVEHGDGAMHQLFDQLPFRPQRVQRAADVVERLQLEELAAKLEGRLLGH